MLLMFSITSVMLDKTESIFGCWSILIRYIKLNFVRIKVTQLFHNNFEKYKKKMNEKKIMNKRTVSNVSPPTKNQYHNKI